MLVIDQFSINDSTGSLTKTERWSENTDDPVLEIQVISVDIHNFDTCQVVTTTKTIMDNLFETYEAKKFVLNMSWIILPCSLSLPDNLDDYIKLVCHLHILLFCNYDFS